MNFLPDMLTDEASVSLANLIRERNRIRKHHKVNTLPAPRRGDHTSADSYLTVVPRGTEFVVFSIDGSFAASVSIMGSDPKVRAGAVDVVR